jgi:hypothetical protein
MYNGTKLLTKTPCDAGSKIALRIDRRQFQTAVEEAVENAAYECGAIQGFPGTAFNLAPEAIKKYDLSIEEHDGNLGPLFIVHQRSSAAPLSTFTGPLDV